MTTHILTPLSRYENIAKIIAMLETQCVQWHVITDWDLPFRISFDQPWIHHYICPNPPGPFFQRCNLALNWFLDHCPLVPEHRYCFMNDDDGYPLNFFKQLSEHPEELLITSMERGHNTPPGVDPMRAHGIGKLVAAMENMKPCGVGIEQVFVSGRILAQCRIPIEPAGDGKFIQYLCGFYPPKFLPDMAVWFNYLEPGRWNK